MPGQLFFVKARDHVGSCRHGGAPAVVGEADTVTFELQVRTLDRDDADLQIGRELANRGEELASLPVADSNASFDLLDDLQIHRPAVSVGENEASGHLYILSIYSRT